MQHLDRIEEAARAQDFSGAVRVEHQGRVVLEFAAGQADRANGRANNLHTRFSIASGTKGLTALTIMSLVESGELTLDATLRSIVGDALPLVDPAVTIDHLLTHRSGVGDYIDEESLGHIDDNTLGSRGAQTLTTPSDYISLLNQHDQVAAPGKRFAYNNSGYVMLSLVIETITGSFHSAVNNRVLSPAVMNTAAFLRSDNLGANVAHGYLESGHTNVFHLPVIGAGDGGIYFTLNDGSALWEALFNGQIVSPKTVELMTDVVSVHSDNRSYGRGFWLSADADHVWIEGMDAGVSFQSGVIGSRDLRYTVIANTSAGAWPVIKMITETP